MLRVLSCVCEMFLVETFLRDFLVKFSANRITVFEGFFWADYCAFL